jgi:hypothetical protein
MLRRIITVLAIVVVVVIGLGVLIQLVPYGRAHANPPVRSEPKWDSPATLALARRACFDCHSNETVWPWYSDVAPISWLIQRDVDEGRSKLNFSNWSGQRQEADHSAREVSSGKMPQWYYVVLHPSAGFSAAEKQLSVAFSVCRSPSIIG